jgi:hypothetical protein
VYRRQKVERLIFRASAMSCVRAPRRNAFATSCRISASRRSRACRSSWRARWGIRSYLPNAAMNALTRFGPDLEVYAEELGDAAATVPETCANPD